MLTFDFFSPEQEVYWSALANKGVRVFIKRDDMIHPYISGNKWRKLKYALQQAQEQHKKCLVTFGGAWSNHLLATACAGATFGFKTVGYVRGEEVLNPVLALCRLYGMDLRFVDRQAYKNKKERFEEDFADNVDAYFIDEGGYGRLAAQGCAEIIKELKQDYDYIFCAAGTGATLAGLALGKVQHAQHDLQIHAVPVLKGGDFIRQEVDQLGVDATDITLHLDYHFGGYAKTKPALLDFIKTFTAETGILIEPTYTGKLFYAVSDLIQAGSIPAGSKVLLLHSGGLTGFLGMYTQF